MLSDSFAMFTAALLSLVSEETFSSVKVMERYSFHVTSKGTGSVSLENLLLHCLFMYVMYVNPHNFVLDNFTSR